jgi:hypothetical protein
MAEPEEDAFLKQLAEQAQVLEKLRENYLAGLTPRDSSPVQREGRGTELELDYLRTPRRRRDPLSRGYRRRTAQAERRPSSQTSTTQSQAELLKSLPTVNLSSEQVQQISLLAEAEATEAFPDINEDNWEGTNAELLTAKRKIVTDRRKKGQELFVQKLLAKQREILTESAQQVEQVAALGDKIVAPAEENAKISSTQGGRPKPLQIKAQFKTFSGKKGEDPEPFLKSIRDYADGNQVYDTVLLSLIRQYLKGWARQWFEFKFRDQKNPDPNVVLNLIRQTFIDEDIEKVTRENKFYNFIMTHDMSVEIYSTLKQSYALNSNISLESKDFRKSFLAGLTKQIGDYVASRATPEDDINQLVKLAKEKEQRIIGMLEVERARKEQEARVNKSKSFSDTNRNSKSKNKDSKKFHSLSPAEKNAWLANKKLGPPTPRYKWCNFHTKWTTHSQENCFLNPESANYRPPATDKKKDSKFTGSRLNLSAAGRDSRKRDSRRSRSRFSRSRSPSSSRSRSRYRSPSPSRNRSLSRSDSQSPDRGRTRRRSVSRSTRGERRQKSKND